MLAEEEGGVEEVLRNLQSITGNLKGPKVEDGSGSSGDGEPQAKINVLEPPPPHRPTEETARSPIEQADVMASPVARYIARDHAIDLRTVHGTGPKGRILKSDVLDVLEGRPHLIPKNSSANAAPSPSPTNPEYKDIPVGKVRRLIAQRMTAAKSGIPHFTAQASFRVQPLEALRKELNADIKDGATERVSLNDFLVKAAASALLAVPQLNSQWWGRDDTAVIRRFASADVSLAVAIKIKSCERGLAPAEEPEEDGLVTPIIRRAHELSVREIAAERVRLVQAARQGRLPPEEFVGGTFTISNLGSVGGGVVQTFTAIINAPQSAILAVGGMHPACECDALECPCRLAKRISVTLSCDHRVVDGAAAARWLAHFCRVCEEPGLLACL